MSRRAGRLLTGNRQMRGAGKNCWARWTCPRGFGNIEHSTSNVERRSGEAEEGMPGGWSSLGEVQAGLWRPGSDLVSSTSTSTSTSTRPEHVRPIAYPFVANLVANFVESISAAAGPAADSGRFLVVAAVFSTGFATRFATRFLIRGRQAGTRERDWADFAGISAKTYFRLVVGSVAGIVPGFPWGSAPCGRAIDWRPICPGGRVVDRDLKRVCALPRGAPKRIDRAGDGRSKSER